MSKKIKVHTVLLAIHAFVSMFSLVMCVFCVAGIKYSSINNTYLVILATSLLIIFAYSSYVAVLYENSVARMKNKLRRK